MEADKLSSSKHLSLPEVGVFLTPPSTPAVKQEPPAGPAADCSRGEDGLVPVPAHQPCRTGKSACHHGSTGPPPESLEYPEQPGYEVYYSPERSESPPPVFTFPSPESPRPDYPAPPGAMLPDQYYTGTSPAAPAGDTLPLPDQRPLTPRYDTAEEPSFEPADTQQTNMPDTDTTQMGVYEVYSNGDFRPWDQSGSAGSLGTTGAFGNYHGSAMSPVSVESTSPVPQVPCYPTGQSPPSTVPPTAFYPPVQSPPSTVPQMPCYPPGQSPPPTVLPTPCYPPAYPAQSAVNSPPAVPSPQGNVPAHFPRDSASPDPGQTFDFPAPFAVPHEASPPGALRHRAEAAMGIPKPPHPGDLSEQQLDRFLRQTRREFSDLLSAPDEPPADRRLPALPCRPEGHHHLGMERPPSPPRLHPPQPGLTDRDLEEVQTLIMQEVSRDIEVAFKVVQVPRDPRTWSHTDVARWLQWTADQYRLPNVYLECFPLDGAQLCDLAEREFIYRAPESGQILYALLEIWKSGITNAGPGARSTVCTINKRPVSFSSPYMPSCAPYPVQDSSPPQTEKAVHLWQFLRELLSQPEAYSRFIRWMDRGKGIFKIEDSVQVARLWGIRKSRPAMNYDKLSRSIRQYYKKGIIRKPDQAQRLVYQFVKN